MPLSESNVDNIVSNIWMSFVGGTPTPIGDAELPIEDRPVMASCIQIAGERDLTIVLRCGEKIVREVTSVMTGEEPDGISRADLEDALGELANMVAGNLKASLPGAAHLSLPMVVDGSDFHLRVLGSRVERRRLYEWQGLHLEVTALGHAPGRGTA